MVTQQQPTTQEVIADEDTRRDTLRDLIETHVAQKDDQQARYFALQLHELETRISVRKQTDKMLRLLQPVRASIWMSTGMIIGAATMMASDTNIALNIAFFRLAAATLACGCSAVLATIAANEFLARKLMRKAERLSDTKVSEIIRDCHKNP